MKQLNFMESIVAKLLAMVVVPLIILWLAVLVNSSIASSIQESSEQNVAEQERVLTDLSEGLSKVENEILASRQSLEALVFDHQIRLLFEDGNNAGQSLDAIADLQGKIKVMQADIEQVGEVMEKHGLLSLSEQQLMDREDASGNLIPLDERRAYFKLRRLSVVAPNMLSELGDATGRTVALMQDGEYNRANTNFRFEERGLVGTMRQLFQSIELTASSLTMAINDRSRAKVFDVIRSGGTEASSYAMMANVLLAVIAVLVGVIAYFVSRRMIVQPLQQQVEVIERLAGGDLDVEMPKDRADELGNITRGLHHFKAGMIKQRELQVEKERADQERREQREAQRQKEAEERALKEAEQKQQAEEKEQRMQVLAALIQDFDRQVQEKISEFTQAGNEMALASNQLTKVSQDTKNQSVAVDTSAQQTEHSVSSMAAALEEFSVSIQELNHQVAGASEISDQALSSSEQGKASIDALSETTRLIEDIISLINDIAEQTNLLALNATIEAARAGEAGRGFAVVAGEVKSLASQTADATKRIEDNIKEMTSATEQSVAAIDVVTGRVQAMNETMDRIQDAIEQQAKATNDISEGIQVASQGVSEITHQASSLTHAANTSSDYSGKVDTVAASLKTISDDLNSCIRHFLVEFEKKS